MHTHPPLPKKTQCSFVLYKIDWQVKNNISVKTYWISSQQSYNLHDHAHSLQTSKQRIEIVKNSLKVSRKQCFIEEKELDSIFNLAPKPHASL